ncbi:MAG: fimbrial protein [Pseudomonadota bacterium]
MTQDRNRFDLPDDEPLDPAVERVRQKMQRVQLVSLSIMMLGFVAVLAAISYRIWFQEPDSSTTATAVPGSTVEASLAVPDGARIVETSLSGDRILIRLANGNGTALWVVDAISGQVISKIALQAD